MAFPIIDLPELDNSKLREACEIWGSFRMVNHGIPSTLMAEMKQVVRSLHDLPSDVKKRNTDVIFGSGYIPPRQANPLYESFGLYGMASPQAVSAFCDQLAASPNQRETIEKYAKALSELLRDIANKIAQSFGISSDLFEEWRYHSRLNRYNFSIGSVGMQGIRTHTDSGFLTILQDDENVGGLEVMSSSGVFVPVDPLPGTLVANLGDMAAIWSNGRLSTVKHRVQYREATVRISIAMLLLGPKEETVVAPREFVDADHPRLYIPVTFEQLRKLRSVTKQHNGEALEHLLLQRQDDGIN